MTIDAETADGEVMGLVAQKPASVRRAVPPGIDCLGARPRDCREFSQRGGLCDEPRMRFLRFSKSGATAQAKMRSTTIFDGAFAEIMDGASGT